MEEEYFRRTGIFPILHLVVLRRSLYAEHPWVASSLYRAFVAAKEVCYRELEQTMEGLRVTAPWFDYHLDDVRGLMPADHWAYGLEPNRHVSYVLPLRLRADVDPAVGCLPTSLFAPNAADRPVASTRSLIGGLTPMAGALDGVVVLEVAGYVSGPYATMLLGDLGGGRREGRATRPR